MLNKILYHRSLPPVTYKYEIFGNCSLFLFSHLLLKKWKSTEKDLDQQTPWEVPFGRSKYTTNNAVGQTVKWAELSKCLNFSAMFTHPQLYVWLYLWVMTFEKTVFEKSFLLLNVSASTRLVYNQLFDQGIGHWQSCSIGNQCWSRDKGNCV